jgi:hypothetical protein
VSLVTTQPAVPDEGTEKLVAIIEFKNRSNSHEEAMDKLAVVKREAIGDIELVWPRRRGSRSGAAWFDSHHHERQGQAIGVRGAASAGQFARVDA